MMVTPMSLSGFADAIVLDEPVVVRPDDGQVGLVVVHHPPHLRAGGLSGEEHLGVYAVDVLFLHALLGCAGPRRALVRHPGWQVVLAAPAAIEVGWVRLARLLAVDEPGVGVVVEAHELGRAVAVLLRDARRPIRGVDLHMRVAGDVVVVHSAASILGALAPFANAILTSCGRKGFVVMRVVRSLLP